MKDIEIEIFDQSNVIFANIAKEKIFNVQKIIDDLSFCLFKYSFIRVLFRKFQFSDELRSKQQIFFFIFQLFNFFNIFQIIVNYINIKIELKKNENFRKQKS